MAESRQTANLATVSPGSGANGADLQLCFNKAHFSRRDFVVDRFVSLARRRASLDVIHNDLRAYLRHLQNAMIELINDDYADFVNLSSSLAVLKESIDKVSASVESSWLALSASTVEIQTSAQFIQQKCGELLGNRRAQIVIRNRIAVLLAIERLARCLDNRPASLSSWLDRLAHLTGEVELWHARMPDGKVPAKAAAARQTAYSRLKKILIEELIADINGGHFHNVVALLRLLRLIGKEDVAVNKAAEGCVARVDATAVDSGSSGKAGQLSALFEQLLRLRQQWLSALERQSQLDVDTAMFVDRILLQFASGYLDDKFGSVFVPSDPNLFHRCYVLTADFVAVWTAAGASPAGRSSTIISALRAIVAKFNIVVYFKMLSQPCQAELKRTSQISDFTYALTSQVDEDAAKLGGCRCDVSLAILRALHRFYADDTVYLPALADRLWDFTLKCLNNFGEWAKLVNEFYRAKNAVDDGKSSLEALVALAVDVRRFGAAVAKLYDDVFRRRFRELGVVDFASMDACLSLFAARVDALTTSVSESVVSILSAGAVNSLAAVSEIPRQYRWTKKPAPTCFSAYLNTTFSLCEDFATRAEEFGWTRVNVASVLTAVVDRLAFEFCERAEKVLESVEQTGTSMQRFKRKMQQQATDGGAPPADVDTDEAKIRAQLAFDVAFMRQRAAAHDVDGAPLEALGARVTQSAANSSINGRPTNA